MTKVKQTINWHNSSADESSFPNIMEDIALTITHDRVIQGNILTDEVDRAKSGVIMTKNDSKPTSMGAIQVQPLPPCGPTTCYADVRVRCVH